MAVPFGKYRLLRKIASGGMGQVFLALERTAGFERLVVLKLILPHLAENDDFLAMFLEEARLVAPLRHPNLVSLHEQLEMDGRYCLVMEYVQGEDLRRLEKFARARGRSLSVGLALRIIAEAAAGLDYAHQARDPQDGKPLKLVHRDVSPQNILVGFDGGVKVIDFGVAKAAGSASHTATGVLKGKYPYMSPEQAGGQPVDGRSDQFALGVVLWELLTGRRLFKGESELMTLRLVRDCEVPPPSQLDPALPPELDALVLRALAPTPAGRFPDCGAFRLAIEDYLLQQRLPASNAHLSAWLRELYAERIASEADPSNLDQLTEDMDLDASSTPSHDSARSALPQPPPPPPAPRSSNGNTKHTRTLLPDKGSRHRFPVVPAAGGGALLIAAGAAFIFLRQASLELTPPVTAPVEGWAQAGPPRPGAERTREPQPVMLQVLSEPAGARVEVDGEQRGETPVDLWLAPDAPPVTVAWQLEGYQPVARRVSAGDAPQVSVTLTPRPTAQKPPRRNTTGSQLGIKTDR